MSELHLLGVRHHGPGSARAVQLALNALEPDCVLIEGPPEASELLHLCLDRELVPPIALLAYAPKRPGVSAFWPYSELSPEWVAMRYAHERGVSCELIDLPLTHQLAAQAEALDRALAEREASQQEGPEPELSALELEEPELSALEEREPTPPHPRLVWAQALRRDPLGYLSTLAQEGALPSEDDPLKLGDRWWEHVIESRGEMSVEEALAFFASVEEVMSVMRAELREVEETFGALISEEHAAREAAREASMRQLIKKHSKGKGRVVVVCGAWHVPALRAKVKATEDKALLKGFPKEKVAMTWAPWSERRLSQEGYGAGVLEPAWHRYLWRYPNAQERAERWLIDAARLLRARGFYTSSAHAIEAARLAISLSALRGGDAPSLTDLVDALVSAFGVTEEGPLKLIYAELVSGSEVGKVPEGALHHPMIHDFELNNKRFKLKTNDKESVTTLDVRKQLHQEKSAYLHQLCLLELTWAQPEARATSRVASGAFEGWRLLWRPEMIMHLIEMGAYGDTVKLAATTRVCQLATRGEGSYDPPQLKRPNKGAAGGLALGELSALLTRALKAQLNEALPTLLQAISDEASLTTDLNELLDALPRLIWTQRYQKSAATSVDVSRLPRVIHELAPRLFLGLPEASASLAEEPERALCTRISALHRALMTSRERSVRQHQEGWRACLERVVKHPSRSPRVAGLVTRLLFDQSWWGEEALFQQARLALSPREELTRCVRWLEGFLSSGGLLLVYQDAVRQVIDRWVCSLSSDELSALLPLLRRTFSAFSYDENRQLNVALSRDLSALTQSSRGASPRSREPIDEPIDEPSTLRAAPTLIAQREVSAEARSIITAGLSWLSLPTSSSSRGDDFIFDAPPTIEALTARDREGERGEDD